MAEQIMQGNASEMAAKQTIPTGYKLTEVGVIPEDWAVIKLGDLSEFVTSGSRGWAQYYSVSGALFIRSQNVRDGKLCLADSQHVNIPQGAEGGRTKVKLNDLLITITGNSVGNVAAASQQFEEAYISQHVGLVRLKDSSIGSYVCRYLSPSAPGNLQIKESQSGQSKPGLNLQNLRDFLIAVPQSRIEARAITSSLDDTDALIASLEQLITKKQAIKAATMQQLLTGRTRLPQFALRSDGTAKGYKTSELGQIPEDWEVLPLGELCHFENGDRSSNYPSSDEFVSFGIPFINAGHIDNGVIDSKGMDYISAVIYARLGGGKVKPGDLVYCLRGSLGKFGVVPDDFGMGAIASSLVIVRPITSRTSCKFISEYFKSDISKRMVSLWAGGAAQPNLGAKELANREFR